MVSEAFHFYFAYAYTIVDVNPYDLLTMIFYIPVSIHPYYIQYRYPNRFLNLDNITSQFCTIVNNITIFGHR